MPYKDREAKRKYQKKWVKAKRVRHGGFDTKDFEAFAPKYERAAPRDFDADGNPIYEEGLCQ